MQDEKLRACFHLASYWLQVIPGGIKAREILISNEMPDESIDENTIQPIYRMTTCFSVISFFCLFKDVERKMELKSPETPHPRESGHMP